MKKQQTENQEDETVPSEQAEMPEDKNKQNGQIKKAPAVAKKETPTNARYRNDCPKSKRYS